MKVIDIFDKVKDLEELQDKLKNIADREDTDDRDELVMYEAVEVIDAYIRELMIKEVKE